MCTKIMNETTQEDQIVSKDEKPKDIPKDTESDLQLLQEVFPPTWCACIQENGRHPRYYKNRIKWEDSALTAYFENEEQNLFKTVPGNLKTLKELVKINMKHLPDIYIIRPKLSEFGSQQENPEYTNLKEVLENADSHSGFSGKPVWVSADWVPIDLISTSANKSEDYTISKDELKFLMRTCINLGATHEKLNVLNKSLDKWIERSEKRLEVLHSICNE